MSHPQALSSFSVKLYWRFYALALTPPSLAVLGAAVYHEFVLHAITTNIVINILIIGTALFGVILMLRTIRGIISEWRGFAILSRGPLDEIGRRAIAPLLGRRLIVHLDELRGSHLSLLDQAHVHEEMNELREGLNGRQELGQYLVGLMVALGLLGTFIGLLETLVGVGQLIGSFGSNSGQSLDDSFRALLGNLQRPLAAMGTAFAASMFGLIGSLLLGLIQIVVRSAQASFINHAHGVMNEIVHIAEAAPARIDDGASPAWLMAVVDDMLSGQRDLAEQVARLNGEATRNEARVAEIAQATLNLVDISRELALGSARHSDVLEAIGRLPLALGELRAAALVIEDRLSASAAEFHVWQRDLDRRHAIALRFFGRLARQTDRTVLKLASDVTNHHLDLLAALAENGARDERREMRRQDLLLTGLDELVGHLRRDEQRDLAREEAEERLLLARQVDQRELLKRLDAFAASDAAPAAAHSGPSEMEPAVERLLVRLDELERRISRDVRSAVKVASQGEDALT